MDWRVPSNIPLPLDFKGFDPRGGLPPAGFEKYERHLPHWRLPGACYFSTFRLNDSIPAETLEEMRSELRMWQRRMGRAAAAHEGILPPEERAAWEDFQRARLVKLDSLLDAAHGECVLRNSELREMGRHGFAALRGGAVRDACVRRHAQSRAHALSAGERA